MSSRKSASSRTSAEPSREEKAAFVKAMLKGIEPGSAAAEATAAKRAGTVKGKSVKGKSVKGKSAAKPAAGTRAAGKAAAGKAAAKKPPAKKTAKTPAAPVAEEPQNRVEILRKITAPAPVETTAKSAEVIALAKEIEKALGAGDLDYLQPHAVQALFQALIKFYGANDENGNIYPVLPGRLAVTGTDAMVVCGALLRAVDLQVFELGMFQSWSGR
ncbi:MAG: hypothetical protein KDJ29_20040 [Hyphomicrobiales bacterium]|nr:hypothetical protein [Hyphomicrobiales bacterium]